MSEDQKWGIWGGIPPGGWCTFEVSDGGDYLGYGIVGTREEAIKGTEGFLTERYRQPESTYEVVRYDPEREPEWKDCKPSPAQIQFLERLLSGEKLGRDRVDNYNMVAAQTPGYRATVDVLYRNGWIFQGRTTRKGREVLAQWSTK